MMNRRTLLLGGLSAGALGAAFVYSGAGAQTPRTRKEKMMNENQLDHPAAPQADANSPSPKVVKTKAEWHKLLPAGVYRVTREAGTEPPFRNAYHDLHEKGIFQCACCGLDLFNSDTKFDSGTGWPSFYQPIAKNRVADHNDTSFGMSRDEVTCARCDAHLGHVFDDGPKPTGLRYCMNSASLVFAAAK